MPTSIKIRGGKQVSERVVVSPYDKWLKCEIFLEVIGNAHFSPRNSALPKW